MPQYLPLLSHPKRRCYVLTCWSDWSFTCQNTLCLKVYKTIDCWVSLVVRLSNMNALGRCDSILFKLLWMRMQLHLGQNSVSMKKDVFIFNLKIAVAFCEQYELSVLLPRHFSRYVIWTVCYPFGRICTEHWVSTPRTMKNTSSPLCDGCCQQLLQWLCVHSRGTNGAFWTKGCSPATPLPRCSIYIRPKADLLIPVLLSAKGTIRIKLVCCECKLPYQFKMQEMK